MYLRQLINIVTNKIHEGIHIRNLSPYLRDYYQQYHKEEIQDYGNMLRKLNSGNNYKYNNLLLYESGDFKVKLINWGPLTRTEIHNHNGDDCILLLLDGKLKEKLFTENTHQKGSLINNQWSLSYVADKIILPSDISFINDKIGYHKIENIYNINKIPIEDSLNLSNIHKFSSLSLHIYSKPNFKSIHQYYDEKYNENEIDNEKYNKNDNENDNKNDNEKIQEQIMREDYI